MKLQRIAFISTAAILTLRAWASISDKVYETVAASDDRQSVRAFLER
jgi:hypothetical protein